MAQAAPGTSPAAPTISDEDTYRHKCRCGIKRQALQINTVPPEAFRLMHEKLLAALTARGAAAATEMMRAHYRELDLNFADGIFGPAPVT